LQPEEICAFRKPSHDCCVSHAFADEGGQDLHDCPVIVPAFFGKSLQREYSSDADFEFIAAELLNSFAEGFDNPSLPIGIGLCKVPHQRGNRHDRRPERCPERGKRRPSPICVSACEQCENNKERYAAESDRQKYTRAGGMRFFYSAVCIFQSIRHPIPGVLGTVRLPDLDRALFQVFKKQRETAHQCH
jgi:hypothetical protein